MLIHTIGLSWQLIFKVNSPGLCTVLVEEGRPYGKIFYIKMFLFKATCSCDTTVEMMRIMGFGKRPTVAPCWYLTAWSLFKLMAQSTKPPLRHIYIIRNYRVTKIHLWIHMFYHTFQLSFGWLIGQWWPSLQATKGNYGKKCCKEKNITAGKKKR